MKAIELTEEQKRKLLEMCRTLFPEFVHIQIRNYYSMSDYVFQMDRPDGKTNGGFDAIEFLTETEYEQEKGDFDGKGYSIHWFEFCITYLADKLFENADAKIQFIIDTWKGNPIDYLYLQYLKLNETAN